MEVEESGERLIMKDKTTEKLCRGEREVYRERDMHFDIGHLEVMSEEFVTGALITVVDISADCSGRWSAAVLGDTGTRRESRALLQED